MNEPTVEDKTRPMRPLLGLSILALLVTACVGAASLSSTGSSVPASAMPSTSAMPTALASAAPSLEASTAPTALASAVAPLEASTAPSAPRSAVAPPAPADVTWSQTPALGFGVGTTTMTVTWKEPAPAGATIRVYGVTACLNPPGTDNVPCLVVKTLLPDKALTLVATAPATQGHVSWTWPSWGNIGGALAVHGSDTYYAFVVAAYTPAGHSKMIIAATASACSKCTF